MQKVKKETFYYDGTVYCVTVPTGMIVVRQNGRVFISGNCQNLTIEELKALVTRVGENTNLVVDGDINQSDLKGNSGLATLVKLVEKHHMDIPIIEFTIEDCVRSGICKQWLEVFHKEGM